MRIPSWRSCIASLSLTGLAACGRDTTAAPPANPANPAYTAAESPTGATPSGRILTSVPIGAGTRDAKGVWTPAQTRRWFALTRSVGGTIGATEFMNEPTLASMGATLTGSEPRQAVVQQA